MCRYEWKKVKLNGKEVFACTTNQQYEDIIWGSLNEMFNELFDRYELTDECAADWASSIRDVILDTLSDNGIIFEDVFDEY